ncbi:MAG: YgfZ/GcvT domain-containing protein [Pirellulaceae bacterium]
MDPSSPDSTSPHAIWFDDYRQLTAGCGLVDLSSRSRVELTGKDRVQFLNGFCTNDIKRLKEGEGCEAFLTNHQGKAVGYVYVRILPAAIVMDAAPGQAERMIEHLNRFVISDRVDFRDLTSTTYELLIAGKNAPQVLSKLNIDSPAISSNYQFQLVTIAGKEACLQRTDYAGENSFFLTFSTDDDAIIEALCNAGGFAGDSRAAEATRIEAGVPLFGVDITEDNLPQEIDRNKQAISFTKGCYLGQETVARIDALGHVNRLLARVKFASEEIPAPGTELFAADKSVGRVTSACWSPLYGSPLAFVLLRRAQAAPRTKLTSNIGPAEVC